MYLEHFHLAHPPFAEEPNPDPDVFFPGARREEICQSLILDVLAGKRLMNLTGREGSGKTLLWRMMAERLPSEYEVVSLDNPTGTFDELVRQLCLDLGMAPRGTESDTDYIEVLHRLIGRKKAEQIKVVVIVDGVEKLHLATLERLLVLVADEELEWTTIFVGQPGFEEYLGQNSVFRTTIDIHAGYVLEDLTESDTRHYLRFCLEAAGMRRAQFEEVFTDAVLLSIFESARGNVRLTNTCAEEILEASCADRSFMVLLEGVEPEERKEEAPPLRWEQRILEVYEMLRYNKFASGALVGIVALVLLVGFLLTGRNDDPAPAPGETPAGASATLSNGTDAAASASSATPGAATPVEWRDGDKLLRERLAASASWLTGMQQGKYTIQLMMLTAPQAQASIATTLTEDDFFRIREQLFIFRKKSNPPAVLVCYGLYNNLDAAREARNNMPAFLRKHHPYPLAVDDAMKKLSN